MLNGPVKVVLLFFFNDTTTPEIFSLSLHDALPMNVGFLPARLTFFGLAVAASERLYLAHIEPALDDLAGDPFRFGVSDQRPRVTCGKLSRADRRLDELGQLQEPQRVGHVTAALAHHLRNLVLMVFELVNERLVACGLFQRIEVLALDVFHDGELERLDVADVENNHRNIMQACALRGLPPSLAGDDFISIAGAPHGSNRNGLNDAAFLD